MKNINEKLLNEIRLYKERFGRPPKCIFIGPDEYLHLHRWALENLDFDAKDSLGDSIDRVRIAIKSSPGIEPEITSDVALGIAMARDMARATPRCPVEFEEGEG